MPETDMPFPGDGEEILQKIRITPEQVIEKLEQTLAAVEKQTKRQTMMLGCINKGMEQEGEETRPALSKWDLPD